MIACIATDGYRRAMLAVLLMEFTKTIDVIETHQVVIICSMSKRLRSVVTPSSDAAQAVVALSPPRSDISTVDGLVAIPPPHAASNIFLFILCFH